jgi:hypothetical protein
VVKFERATGHRHPNFQTHVDNYKVLLQQMGRSEEEIEAVLREIAPEFF